MNTKKLIILSCLVIHPVYAEQISCADIPDEKVRLQCYDELSRQDYPKRKSLDALLPRERFEYLRNRETFTLSPYEPIYFMPVAYANKTNEEPFLALNQPALEKLEVKYQISTRVKISDKILGEGMDVWFGYTQKTFWQLYNNDLSAAFRETDYKPELWISCKTGWELFEFTNRFVDVGITHESNGQSELLSRSWNRVFVRFGLEYDRWAMMFMPWIRISENADDDDNPDIEEYAGKAEFRVYHKRETHMYAMVVRNNLDTDINRGSVEFNVVFPFEGRLKGMLQYFNGYGESLIDYDKKMRRVSLGLVLIDWL
ncbi:MAG: phospholipase [Pseudomonadota bacterium]|nr:phospholipase [Pseudomonadota bacterium]